MITYNRYVNSTDFTWYDSTNTIYSECMDSDSKFKTLKIVFKGGRTYIYNNVDINDYLQFKMAESNGKALNEFIVKKYKGERIDDTNLNELEELKESFMKESQLINESMDRLSYNLSMSDDGNFILKLNGNKIFEGIEGQVSIVKLLKSMNISYSFDKLQK